MNVSSIKTDDYSKNPAFAKNRNKANSNPIQSQFQQQKFDIRCLRLDVCLQSYILVGLKKRRKNVSHY